MTTPPSADSYAFFVHEMAEEISPLLPEDPRVAVVLGSGLGEFSAALKQPIAIPYQSIPHYPESTVAGHAGELVFGYAAGVPVLAARGRFHYYEGHSLATVMLPLHLFARLGARAVIITNAAGCLRSDWQVGDLMLMTGHLDATFISSPGDPPLVAGEPHHSQSLLDTARQAARHESIPTREGVYAWALGPSYETPLENRAIRGWGGDAVGMSTVPEIRAAVEADMQVLGISCLTNYAAGMDDRPLTHAEVLATGQRVKTTFQRLVTAILQKMNDG